jgi:ATP/maltotriose-dependent transcriptional regulator MalT/DNA-binding SARP family transcriptional activator
MKLTLVTGPAGYGKTSALIDFAQRTSVPVCWYTADERDRDLGVLIAYLVGAIREQFPGFGDRTQAALSTRGGDLFHDPTATVADLVNDMLDLSDPFVLVVDNYESLDGAFGLRRFLYRLLEVLPVDCHIILGSRVLPDVPVTQLVAKRQIVGLTAADLRFDAEEVRDLLRLSQIEVSARQAERIAASAEGWITGVLLLADLLREKAGTTLLGAERATSETYGYLAREVLAHQPPDVQHFLHTSAVLREMSTRLCREILGVREAPALLSEVERRNLFVTRFGPGGIATYRYHSLFRDFLQEQLRFHHRERYVALHHRAGAWFEDANDVEEAVYHYLAAESYPEATVLMERVAMEWFTRGRSETLLQWADRLPEEVRDRAPRLSLYQSKVLADRYEYRPARRALAHAEAGFASGEDASALARVHNQRATLALFEGRYDDVVSEAETALAMLDPGQVSERAESQRLIGRAHVGSGRLDKGMSWLRDALALYRQIESPYNIGNLLQDLVVTCVDLGRLDEAMTFAREALTIGRRLGAPSLLAGILNNLGWLHYARGEYDRALVLYEEGLTAAQRGGDLSRHAYISAGMADLYRDIGAYERAERFYEVGRRTAEGREPSLTFYIFIAQADMYRWRGDAAQARECLAQAHQLAQAKRLDFEMRGLLPVAEGALLVEIGEIESGLATLSQAVRFLEQRRAVRELARARFLLARGYLAAGDQTEAVAELERALALAEEIGTDQWALAEGQHARDLLELGRAQGLRSCRALIERVEDRSSVGQQDGVSGAGVEPPEHRLEIYALGEGRVVRDGEPIASSTWHGVMTKELFFYILLHGPLERDAIGLVFWPDLSSKKMTDSFHTTLYRVRRAVGSDVIVVEDGEYQLGEVDYWFDVEEFEGVVARARLLPPHDWQAEHLWRRALSLYQGDFLPEVERTWSVPQREALRGMYLEALLGMGRSHEARSEFEGAVECYKRALTIDELREEIHRRIMRCYAEAGRRAEAVAQYRRCRETLRRELDIAPSEETQRLYEQIAGKRQD